LARVTSGGIFVKIWENDAERAEKRDVIDQRVTSGLQAPFPLTFRCLKIYTLDQRITSGTG
jgi:hypothetical protein